MSTATMGGSANRNTYLGFGRINLVSALLK
jgi:hypothetical protein